MQNVLSGKKPKYGMDKTYLARVMVKWLALDCLTFGTVKKPGFRSFCMETGIIQSYDELPSESTLRVEALNDVYDVIKIQMKKKLATFEYGALTTDMW